MAKFRSPKTSFLGGEISGASLGRLELPFYPYACQTMLNMIPIASGGAYRRPGTFFEANLGAVSTIYAPAIIPFIYSQSEVYCIEIGKTVAGTGYAKAYRPTSNSVVSTASNITGAHLYDRATFAGGLGAYDEWHDIKYPQSADILYLVHPNRKPIRITRTAADTFALAAFDNGLTGATFRDAWPYLDQNTTAITLTVSNGAVGTGRTVTASAPFFASTHVGAVFKQNHGGTIGCFRITAFTNSTSVTAEVMVELEAAAAPTTANATWWESAWSDYQGWPRTVCFYQDRLAYGGTLRKPDSIWFSTTSSYNAMSVSTITLPYSAPTGAQPFTLGLLSQQLNVLQWMSPSNTLAIGTLGDEWLIDRESPTSGFGADNSKADVVTKYGSSYCYPQRVGNELIFAQKSEDTLRSFIFNFQEDSFTGEPIQHFYQDFPKSDQSLLKYGNRKFRRFTWDQGRDTLWCNDTQGNLFGLTRDRRLQINAWHRHQLGGFDSTVTGSPLGSGSTLTSDPAYVYKTGSVVSIISIPNPVIGQEDLWMVVYRKINGTFRFYLERMIGKFIPFETAYAEGFSSDIGLYLTDSSIYDSHASADGDSITGLTHLEGESIYGHGRNTNGWFYMTGAAVSGAASDISLKPGGWTSTSTICSLGLNYSSVLVPVRVEAGSQIGTAQAAMKSFNEVTVRFHRTMAAKIGRDADNLEQILFRTGQEDLIQSAEFFTGDKKVYLDDDYNRDGLIYILQDRPLPFHVVSVFAEGMEND